MIRHFYIIFHCLLLLKLSLTIQEPAHGGSEILTISTKPESQPSSEGLKLPENTKTESMASLTEISKILVFAGGDGHINELTPIIQGGRVQSTFNYHNLVEALPKYNPEVFSATSAAIIDLYQTLLPFRWFFVPTLGDTQANIIKAQPLYIMVNISTDEKTSKRVNLKYLSSKYYIPDVSTTEVQAHEVAQVPKLISSGRLLVHSSQNDPELYLNVVCLPITSALPTSDQYVPVKGTVTLIQGDNEHIMEFGLAKQCPISPEPVIRNDLTIKAFEEGLQRNGGPEIILVEKGIHLYSGYVALSTNASKVSLQISVERGNQLFVLAQAKSNKHPDIVASVYGSGKKNKRLASKNVPVNFDVYWTCNKGGHSITTFTTEMAPFQNLTLLIEKYCPDDSNNEASYSEISFPLMISRQEKGKTHIGDVIQAGKTHEEFDYDGEIGTSGLTEVDETEDSSRYVISSSDSNANIKVKSSRIVVGEKTLLRPVLENLPIGLQVNTARQQFGVRYNCQKTGNTRVTVAILFENQKEVHFSVLKVCKVSTGKSDSSGFSNMQMLFIVLIGVLLIYCVLKSFSGPALREKKKRLMV